MENKYYTPEISEFYAGFEYEGIPYDGHDWIQEKWYGNVDDTNDQLMKEHIRVKYLDKEDIESLGFKWTKTTNTDIYYELLESDTSKYTLIFSINEWLDTNIYISKERISFEDTYYKDIFEGNIKNKSELKKVLKMIGVIE